MVSCRLKKKEYLNEVCIPFLELPLYGCLAMYNLLLFDRIKHLHRFAELQESAVEYETCLV